ncbi:MAG: hypothetical protein V9H69_24645 [Anaerolineae bacterium]
MQQSNDPPPIRRHPGRETLKRNQTIAFYISFIALGLAFSSLGPTLPSLASNTGSTLGQISILFTVQALGLLLGNFLSGRRFDRSARLSLPGHGGGGDRGHAGADSR